MLENPLEALTAWGHDPDLHASAPLADGRSITAIEHQRLFLDAVKRDDALAAELYIDARGVNLSSRDEDGRSALEIARANGNTRLAQMLSRNLPAAR